MKAVSLVTQLKKLNLLLLVVVITMNIFSIYAIYSATWIHDSPFWLSQIKWILICFPLFIFISYYDYHWIHWGAIPIYLLSLLLLILVFFIGVKVFGARSWLNLGFGNFQPSQLAIFGGILIFSLFLDRYEHWHPILKIIICLIITTIPACLILIQPYLGGTLVWFPVLLAMLYISGIKKRYLLTIIIIALLAMPLMYYFGLKQYQKDRLIVFMDPSMDPLGAGWTINQSLNAIGSGGIFGKGFKAPNTLNELGYLPSTIVHTDFIYSVFGEQHGFIGSVCHISVFCILFITGFYIALQAYDHLGKLLAVGIIMLLFTHTFMNIGMTIAITPITGLPLPLVSYGGSFMLIVMVSLGLLESIWIHRKTAPTIAIKSKNFKI